MVHAPEELRYEALDWGRPQIGQGPSTNRRWLRGPVSRELITAAADEECGQLLVTNLVCEPISSLLDADGSRWRVR
jgi:hypothetical protein